MFCKNCGTQLPENAAFCANCGTAQETQPVAPVEEAPVAPAEAAVETPVAAAVETPVATAVETPVAAEPQYTQAPTYQAAPVYNAAPAGSVDAKNLMIKGILAIALCEFGIPGIILGSMAKKLAAQFMAENGGQIFGKAKVGSILGRVGFGVGIAMTIFWAIYILIIGALM